MSIKKDKILAIALELFANLGFDATSTSKIAKLSGVSEGLIFRHFGNKQGLLEAIMLEAEQKSQQVFAHIFFETNPKEVIKKLIALPFALPK
ncbi:MAG: helix-turn-helix domain-containing protein, partial [Bacteroidota bacterium]